MLDPLAATSVVFFEGKIVPAAEARISLSDQGLLYGVGFFETFRTSGGRLHHWSFNCARLKEACRHSGISVPASFLAVDESRLSKAVELFLHATGRSDAVFRYTITAGSGDTPVEFLTTRPLPGHLEPDGIRLRVLNVERDSGEWIPRPKSLNYLNATLGIQEMKRREGSPSDEGLFLARLDGSVVETPRQSIAWVRDDRIYSPAATVGGVAGTCIVWMISRGTKIHFVHCALAEFLAADAIFVCNAVRGVSPVREVWDQSDSVRLGTYDSITHPVILRLQEQWRDSLMMTAEGRKWE